MKLKQSAALGLSGLILSSNLLLPGAIATPMAMTSQADLQEQLIALSTDPASVILAEQEQQQVLHPMVDKKKRHSLFHYINPFGYLVRKYKTTQTAQTIPVQTADSTTASPLNPEVAINPAIAPIAIEQTSDDANAEGATSAEAVAAPSKKETYTQINLPLPKRQPGNLQQASETAAQPLLPDEQQAQPPVDSIMKSDIVENKLSLKKPSAEEVFQMLAASPLEKLAAASKSMMMTPHMDSGSPDASTFKGEGDISVLKSGISQKTSSVDITIGKAEVIYLSKPASRVSVSNPEVASAVVISPTQIQLVGKAVGVSNLLIWSDMYSADHTVVDVSVHRDVSVLISQLKYVDPGIQIVPMAAEDTVILTGQAETRESAQLAIEMAKAFFSKTMAATTGNGPNSQAPGSALPGGSTNVINLIKVKGEPSTKVELVRQQLKAIDPNIRIDVVPGPDGSEKVILTGRVQNASIASKALNMASVFYGQPGLKIVTAQGGNDFTRMTVDSGSSSSGGATATTTSGTAAGGVNMLQGSVMTDATGNVISMLEIAQKPQIKCNIKFLEVNKGRLNALGGTFDTVRGATKFSSTSGTHSPAPNNAIAQVVSTVEAGGYNGVPGAVWGGGASRGNGTGWDPTGQGFGQGFGQQYLNGVTQVFSINNQLAGAIQALQERNIARTLAEPTLTMLSGEQGSFLAGGEIPVAFQGGQGQVSIEYKQYGIRLNLLPTVTDDGKIQMQVSPEVSTIDRSVNILGVPGFLSRRMSTNLLVEPGQSFVLAGLFKKDEAESVSRFPGIGSLPVIGTFFRNKWKNRQDTEMVVIVKPEIIYSQTGQTQQASNTPSSDGENPAQVSKN